MGNHAYKCSYNSSQSCWTVCTGNFPSIPSTPHATEVFSLVPKILFSINWILVQQLYLWEVEILNLLTGSLRSGEEESLTFSTVLCNLLISCQNGICLPFPHWYSDWTLARKPLPTTTLRAKPAHISLRAIFLRTLPLRKILLIKIRGWLRCPAPSLAASISAASHQK